jgi:two-component system chemotaxis response regulator CheB
MIKLLIVDDSALMRRQLSALFVDEPDFSIRTARNGREAVEENRNYQPDVVTLDINMPEMDGLTALSMIMVERPVAVVMVSSLTEKGALATLEALNLGAVDYVAKPGGTISLSIDAIRAQLISKVRTAAKARLKPLGTVGRRGASTGTASDSRATSAGRSPLPAVPAVRRNFGSAGVVVIGVSTGGPRTLEGILPQLPAGFPWSVLVAQHMPASFTAPFAQRLNGLCALPVVEASRPMALEPGTIYIAKGGADMQVALRAGKPTVIPSPENSEFLWHPSVELLGRTALEHFDASHMVGVMLTGMGNDGSDSFANIKQRGGRTIAESEDSAVVFGMPAELIKKGGATVTLHADKIGRQINAWVLG